MNSKLKPCPFCGASYDKDEDDFVYAADHKNWCPLRGMAYGGYGLTVGDTEEEIDAWNTRAIDRDALLKIADSLDEGWEQFHDDILICEDVDAYEREKAEQIRKAVGA